MTRNLIGPPTYLYTFAVYIDRSNYYVYLVKDAASNRLISLKMSVMNRYVNFILRQGYVYLYFLIKPFMRAFISFFINVSLSAIFTFKKRLKFHGLAFGVETPGIDAPFTDKFLRLNVGFSKAPIIFIPGFVHCVRVSRNKRKVLVESNIFTVLTDFVVRIKDIKPVGVYYNPAKRGGRRGIRLHLSFIPRKKFNKDVK